jgi:predicted transcriptional regulator
MRSVFEIESMARLVFSIYPDGATCECRESRKGELPSLFKSTILDYICDTGKGALMEKSAQSEERAVVLNFLLASIDRRRILSELRKEDLHLNELAKRLDITATEALRQLQRMTEARLLEKMPDGKYRLTPYAKVVLDNTAPLDFVSKFREFFLEHDASLVPQEYRARFGELSGAKMTTSTVETINLVTDMFEGAEKKIDASVLGMRLHLDIATRRLQEGLKVRWLMDESFLTKAKSIYGSAKQLPEMRWTPRIIGHINVTDKVGMLTLRRNDGTMSYFAFYGEDASIVKWANDMFTHEWEKAKPWYP